MQHHPSPSRRFASLLCALLTCAILVAGCTAQPGSLTHSPTASESTAATTQPGVATATTSSSAATSSTTASASPAQLSPSATLPAEATTTPPRNPRLYPDARLTPGDVLGVTAAQVSVPGYSSKVRNVPTTEKRAVYSEYDLAYPQKSGAFECDHFIPLCLGGSNSIKNLWPEPAPQFHWKDGLEVYLWHEVRAKKITLAEAQREIRTDWYTYWVKAGKPGSNVDADTSAAQSAAPAAKPAGSLIVGWSVSGARYHYLTCAYFAQIKPANRRTGTVAEAKAAGKTPCKVCRPPE